MQIDRIEIFHLTLPWKTPRPGGTGVSPVFVASTGETPVPPRLETVLVRMDGEEASGWGEASPGNAPQANGEWAGGAWLCLRDWLAPAVVEKAIDSGDNLAERLDRFGGNRFAKGALDAAWWDLSARLQNRPLHQLLGGCREAIEVGASFDQMASIDELLAAIGQARDAGYARVELKFRPGWDVEMLRVVRQEFPTLTLHVDFEGRLGLEHAEMLYRLDDFGLAMIEQPLAAGRPGRPRHDPREPTHADLPGRKHRHDGAGRNGPRSAQLPLGEPQAGKGWRLDFRRGDSRRSATNIARRVGLGRRRRPPWGRGWPWRWPRRPIAAIRPTAFPRRTPWSRTLPTPCRRSAQADGVLRVPLWSASGIGVDPDGKLLEKFCLQRAKFPSQSRSVLL